MRFGYAILSVIACLLFFVSVGYAQGIDLETLDMENLVKTYNENLEKVPNFVKSIFGNEKIDVYIDGEKFVGLVGKNGNITEYKKGGLDKPTMKIYTTVETISDLIDNEKSLAEAIKDKSIRYEGVGFAKKLKFGFIRLLGMFFFK